MRSFPASTARAARYLVHLGGALVLSLTALSAAADTGSLRAKFSELRHELGHNSFQRALHIDSSEAGDTLTGDVYALLEHPFATVKEALRNPGDWCDILLLPFNTKFCQASGAANSDAALHVRIGRKFDQPVENAYRIDFAWRPVALTQDYFETRLNAGVGPVGTRDYRITVSAIPVQGGRTFMHLSYSYGFGFAGRLAMQAYLSTAGADKVGFTTTGKGPDGRPLYIGGMRGAVERNAMRYYLAIDAHLASQNSPPDQRMEKRIHTWFNATERYPRQLREMDRATYVSMKRGEYERKQAAIQ